MNDTSPKIEIYTTRTCGFCFAAKKLLQTEGYAYIEYDVSERPETRAWLVEQSGQRTVPQIFINEVSIGGFRELRNLFVTGKRP